MRSIPTSHAPASGSVRRSGVAVGLAIALACTAAWFFAWYAPGVRDDALRALERELTLRADERRTAVNAWFDDRLDDVQTIAQFPTVRELVGMPTDGGPGIGDRAHLGTVLAPFRRNQGLSALFVVDAAGRVVASALDEPVLDDCVRAAMGSPAVPEGSIDVHAHPDGELAVHFVVDVGQAGGRVVAESLPGQWLCPLVALAGPSSSRSAEWRLMHRVGDDVTWVCSSEGANAGALTERRSLATPGLGSIAALGPHPAFGAFVDGRGVPVFAATRPLVPGWGLALKVDQAEVLGDIRRHQLRGGAIVAALALGLAALVLVAWRSRESEHQLSIARVRARQASLVEQANEAILFLAPDGRVIDANARATAFYGRARGELTGLYVPRDLCPPEEQEAGQRQLATVARGESLAFETVHLRRDGTRVPVEVSSTLVQDESGPVVVSVVRDISERLAAHRRQARLNRVLRTLSEVNHLLLTSADEGTLVTSACRAIAETGGFEFAWIGRAEADGRLAPVAVWGRHAHLMEGATVRWDGSALWSGPSTAALRTRTSTVIRDALADPSLAPWRSLVVEAGLRSAVVCPVFVRNGPYGTLSLYSTELDAFDPEAIVLLEKLAADLGFGLQALEDRQQRTRSEAQFRTVFDNAALGIVLASMDGRTLRANQAFLRMLGYTEQELQAMRFDAFTHPEDVPHEMPLYHEILAGQRDTYQLEKRFVCRDGRVVWAALTVSTVRDASGAPAYFIALVEDVSERRRLQEQFLQAQKMESIGRLAGGVAHDFNNLLTAVLGYADLLRAELPRGGDAQVFVDEIAKAGTRATALTSQLLAFARRQVIEPRLIDLNALVADAERLLRRLVGEDVEMVVAASPGLAPVVADAGQLHQLLVNLVVNARDAMPDGGRLTIETCDAVIDEAYARSQLDLRPGAYVMLAVSDTGVGIPPEVRPHLFEPFYTTKELGKGTGLGLATCHGIVTQSGGFITVYSEVGSGTTFRVYLPRAQGSVAEPAASPPEGALRPGSETILLAEDEPAVRQLAALSLRSQGYRVLEAADGEGALEVACAHQGTIHLLVTDVVMPRLAGRELAARFTALRPDARVLFMSGHPEQAIASDGVLEPGVWFLPKPFTPERLARKVRDVLDATSPE